jgi:hypothetical protein
MKAWRRSRDATLKSLVLEFMAAEFMRGWEGSRTGYVFDDWLVRATSSAIMVAHYYSAYALPTSKRINTGVGWIEQAKQSHLDAITACSLGDSSPNYVTYWRRVVRQWLRCLNPTGRTISMTGCVATTASLPRPR